MLTSTRCWVPDGKGIITYMQIAYDFEEFLFLEYEKKQGFVPVLAVSIKDVVVNDVNKNYRRCFKASSLQFRPETIEEG